MQSAQQPHKLLYTLKRTSAQAACVQKHVAKHVRHAVSRACTPSSWLRAPTKGPRWDWRSPPHPVQKLPIFTDEHFFFNLKKTLRRESPLPPGEERSCLQTPGWTSLRWSPLGAEAGSCSRAGGWPHHTATMSGTPAPALQPCPGPASDGTPSLGTTQRHWN